MDKKKLLEKIRDCQECKLKYGEFPFFFPMEVQKVMLISACPSIQAMFRPLTSIRFFRTICIALFGDANISPEYIRALHDEIYWTHIHKCYNEEALKSGDFNKIPNKCMETYIEAEVSILQPKIIISLGKVVAERLFKKELACIGHNDLGVLQDSCVECSKWGARVFITDFPETGAEERFDITRNVLSEMQGIGFMKRHKNGSWTGPLNHEHGAVRGLRVNLGFERRTVEQLKQTQTDNPTEDSWLENVVLPNIKNYDTLARLEFFIEDQVRTMLMEVFSHAVNWRIIKDLEYKEFASGKPLDQKNVYKFLENSWVSAFRDYFIYLLTKKNWTVDLPDGRKLDSREINILEAKLKELSKIRNCIVHHGGYAPPVMSLNGGRTKFQGIRWYVNLVYVSDVGIESVKNFVEDIISIIAEHDNMRFG